MFVNLRVVDGSFLSTLSLRRATSANCSCHSGHPDFYPRSPCGERPTKSDQGASNRQDFYPRSPCGERRSNRPATVHTWRFLSTLSLRRATLAGPSGPAFLYRFLSTLSLRRATISPHSAPDNGRNFYPRSPCGERHSSVNTADKEARFLSTLSLRRATQCKLKLSKCTPYFYPRSPCGERHLPSRPIERKLYFYPRSPCGERQYLVRGQRPNWRISIHALLAESDASGTLSDTSDVISIHALLAESDDLWVM